MNLRWCGKTGLKSIYIISDEARNRVINQLINLQVLHNIVSGKNIFKVVCNKIRNFIWIINHIITIHESGYEFRGVFNFGESVVIFGVSIPI